MAYYFHVLALCVGVALCFVLGRALFDLDEPTPTPAPRCAQADSRLSRAVRADAGPHSRK